MKSCDLLYCLAEHIKSLIYTLWNGRVLYEMDYVDGRIDCDRIVTN